jgi:hypothetical protein
LPLAATTVLPKDLIAISLGAETRSGCPFLWLVHL